MTCPEVGGKHSSSTAARLNSHWVNKCQGREGLHLHGVNHVLREAVRKQDVVDLDGQTLSLFAGDVHGYLRTQCTATAQGEDDSGTQCCAMATLQELCCESGKSRKMFSHCSLRRVRGMMMI